MASVMDEVDKAVTKHALPVAMGGTLGVVAGLTNAAPVHLRHAGAGAPAASFAQATTHALRHGATVTGALGAGATAAVGGPAVVAAAVAAAPFVLGAAAVGAIGFGLYKLFSDD